MLLTIEALTAEHPDAVWTHAGRRARVHRQSGGFLVELLNEQAAATALATQRAPEAAGLCLHWLMSHEVIPVRFPLRAFSDAPNPRPKLHLHVVGK